MKRLLSILVTLLVLLGINIGVSVFTNTNFIDFSFGIGLIASVVIWFFSSKGGYTARYTDVMLQAETTNWKMKHEKHKFQRNTVFYTSLAYTIISIVATVIYYKDYFIEG